MNKDFYTQSVKDVKVNDGFFSPIMETTRTQMLPYQWNALNDAIPDIEPSHCIQNFKIAAGISHGEFHGKVFQDSDLYKWIEAAAYSLKWHPDSSLEKQIDEAIDLIVSTQQSDGYIGTYYTINGLDKRWTNIMGNHELYCAGHMLEAAVAYYEITGKRKLLDAMIRFVDYIDSIFGPEDDKLHAYPGHEIIEMALMRLYNITHDEKHLNLAAYFINERGKQPCYFDGEIKKYNNIWKWKDSYFKFDYYQAGKPVRGRGEAVGHAVRAVYLYSGIADVARASDDEELYTTCKKLWDNIVHKKMFITGALGSSSYGESFTIDYDLPNDLVYGETCASVAMVFFALRMLKMEQKGEYADVMEKLLYNGTISGMSLDGKSFFYVNPLEVYPEKNEKIQAFRHVKVKRQTWFSCACCPPNLARLVESLGSYIYTENSNSLYVNLYIGNQANVFDNTTKISMHSNYPWDGNIKLNIDSTRNDIWKLALHIPSWCHNYTINVDGKPADYTLNDGYAYIEANWNNTHTVEFNMDITARIVRSNPKVRENIGKITVMRGPVVYCLEEEDNGNNLHEIEMPASTQFKEEYRPDMLGGIVTISATGRKIKESDSDDLYIDNTNPEYEDKDLLWIPYYAWDNRHTGEMMVWVRD